MKKIICEIERRRSLCRLSGCLRPSQEQRKRRSLANNCCGPARQLEQIIARRIADAARRNLSRSAAIRSANSKRLVTGLNCSWTQKLSQQKNFQLFDRNATN